jgi:hypothetical protein
MEELEVVRRHPVKQRVAEEITPSEAVGVHKEILLSGSEKGRLGALKLYYETQDALTPGGAGRHLHLHVPDFAEAKKMLLTVREAREALSGES